MYTYLILGRFMARIVNVRSLVSTLIGLTVVVLCGGSPAYGQRAGDEILYPSKDYAKLDTFEGLNLEDADKLYGKQDYTGAYAAYKAYSFEFTKSPALPYVLLRMGRCLHQLGKRNAAIKGYQDVVDYFPDAVSYAAGALFYIGECHGQNGDNDKKTAVWARMVKDDDYVAQPNSGTALAYLGQAMEKLGRFEEAAEYNWRTAVTFAQSNPAAAQAARNAVLFHYVVRSPNHEKLKEFFTKTLSFGIYRGKGENPEEDRQYWSTILSTALGTGGTPEEKSKSCSYWTSKMGDRFADDDGLRRQWFDALRVQEQDRSKWLARMEKQFAQKPASVERILQWCDFFRNENRGDVKLRSAFFAKHIKPFLAGIKFKEMLSLMEQLKRLEMDDEAQAAIRSVNTQGLSDEEIKSYAFFVANYEGEDGLLKQIKKMKDSMFAAKSRYDYYYNGGGRYIRDAEKALAEIPALKKDPKYAGQALAWAEADLLRHLSRYEEAIKAYQAANKQPDSTWAVTDCLIALKQYDQAIKNVQGLESVGGAVAAQACLKIADIYRAGGDKGKEVDQLRLTLRRYPKSSESSQAHQRLESYGVKISGGEAQAEE